MSLSENKNIGINNVKGKVEEYNMPGYDKVRWLKVKKFIYTE